MKTGLLDYNNTSVWFICYCDTAWTLVIYISLQLLHEVVNNECWIQSIASDYFIELLSQYTQYKSHTQERLMNSTYSLSVVIVVYKETCLRQNKNSDKRKCPQYTSGDYCEVKTHIEELFQKTRSFIHVFGHEGHR